MVIEFVGPPGAGKSAIFAALDRLPRSGLAGKQGIENGAECCKAYLWDRLYAESPIWKRAVLSRFLYWAPGLRNLCLSPRHLAAHFGQRPELAELCNFVIANYCVRSGFLGIHRIELFERCLGMFAAIMESGDSNTIYAFDEFFCQRCISFCLGNPGYGGFIEGYVERMPRPSLVVAVKVEQEVAIARVRQRPKPRYRRTDAEIADACIATDAILSCLDRHHIPTLSLDGTVAIARNIELIRSAIGNLMSGPTL